MHSGLHVSRMRNLIVLSIAQIAMQGVLCIIGINGQHQHPKACQLQASIRCPIIGTEDNGSEDRPSRSPLRDHIGSIWIQPLKAFDRLCHRCIFSEQSHWTRDTNKASSKSGVQFDRVVWLSCVRTIEWWC